jgi:DNA primase
MNCTEAKKIDIIDFLAKNGIKPTQIKGFDYWYKSPLRNETTPSFKVNSGKNIWFDFGLGEGGDIIKLGCMLFKTDVSGFLKVLASHYFSLHQPKIEKVKTTKIEVLSVTNLEDSKLINYIKSREIDINMADQYCKQIEYVVGDNQYKAVGFKNMMGGWELRSISFKGASSKDISFISRGSKSIVVVEGFFDLLSYIQLYPDEQIRNDLIVLNSLSLLRRAQKFIEHYSKINLFLDNDSAGRTATDKLIDTLGQKVKDRWKEYYPLKDLNAKLIHQELIKLLTSKTKKEI